MIRETRDIALSYLIRRYTQWPTNTVTEEKPVTDRIWGRWRWVLSLDGEVMFGNGIEPAITIMDFRYAQGNREVYNVH